MSLIWGIAQFVSGIGAGLLSLALIMTMLQEPYVDYYVFSVIVTVLVVSAITNLSGAYRNISGDHTRVG